MPAADELGQWRIRPLNSRPMARRARLRLTNSLNLRRISYDAAACDTVSRRSGRHDARAIEGGRTTGRGSGGRQRARYFAHRRPAARDRGARGGAHRERTFQDASYARTVRGQTGLTQAAFAARIGVPVETVRNWEQGKRSPRGPARALLKVLERAPDAAFAVLGKAR